MVGCEHETGDAFQVTIVAFTGDSETFPTKWRAGVQAAAALGIPRQAFEPDGDAWWLFCDPVRIEHNDQNDRRGDVFDWRQAEVVADPRLARAAWRSS